MRASLFQWSIGPLSLLAGVSGCVGDLNGEDPEPTSPCGPTRATVTRVIDGDTVELDDGEKLRYLLIDTPELSPNPPDCWAEEATEYNRQLVEGQEIEIAYDQECTDIFGRRLGYLRVGGMELNQLLVERGHACVLHIPPNGDDRVDLFRSLEAQAQAEGRGMWGSCATVSCAD